MPSALFDVVHLLERHGIHFTIERTRPDTIRLNATLVGQRLEIEVFEDDHVEVSRFTGNEDIEGGFAFLEQLLADDAAS